MKCNNEKTKFIPGVDLLGVLAVTSGTRTDRCTQQTFGKCGGYLSSGYVVYRRYFRCTSGAEQTVGDDTRYVYDTV